MSATEQHLSLNNTIVSTVRGSKNTQSVYSSFFFHAKIHPEVQYIQSQQQKEIPCFTLKVSKTFKQTLLVQMKICLESMPLISCSFQLLISVYWSVSRRWDIYTSQVLWSIFCEHALTLSLSNNAKTLAVCVNFDPRTLGSLLCVYVRCKVGCISVKHSPSEVVARL